LILAVELSCLTLKRGGERKVDSPSLALPLLISTVRVKPPDPQHLSVKECTLLVTIVTIIAVELDV